jgi:hypothetical protein
MFICLVLSVFPYRPISLLVCSRTSPLLCEISSSHGGEYDVQNCLVGCTAVSEVHTASIIRDEAVRTSETSVDNYFTRQYSPQDNSEHHSTLFPIVFYVLQ